MPSKTIKVFVVDDSSLFRKMIIDYLSSCPDIQVVGYAFNAYDARKKIPVLKPDVITMDVEMPGLNGIDFLKDFLPLHPIPVVLVSSLNLNVFDVLSAGAVDFVRKPDMNIVSKEQFFSALNSKIHIASFAKVRCASRKRTTSTAASTTTAPKKPLFAGKQLSFRSTVIALGASTGGTEATLAVLKQLPADIPGMVITQHMPEGFTAMYAQRLNKLCQMEVREAKNGDQIHPGLVLIAPGSQQMEVVRSANGGYAVRGRFIPFRCQKCSRQQDRDHHDRYGKRRRGGLVGNAQKGSVHDRAGQSLLRGLRNADGCLQYRSGIYPGRL